MPGSLIDCDPWARLVEQAEQALGSGEVGVALRCFRSALSHKPDFLEALLGLARLYAGIGLEAHAGVHLEEALKVAGDDSQRLVVVACTFIELAQLCRAAELLRSALRLDPANREAASILLYVLNHVPDLEAEMVVAEHVALASALYGRDSDYDCRTSAGPRIRIGFLSGDLCNHPVAAFFEPVLELLDRNRFDPFVYGTQCVWDDTSRRLAAHPCAWRDVSALAPDELVREMRADALDLVVELSGHTVGGRLHVLARRVAASQVSWLGYPNTTGLDSIDFRIVDETLCPSTACSGSERRLPLPDVFACFRPPRIPRVESRAVGPLVFGSFHRLIKINSRVLDVWARVMREQPDAKLLFVRNELHSARQFRLRKEFEARGVDESRISFRKLGLQEQHWDCFGDIDVMLDPWPWGGHTISCESLVMGVPVVTRLGEGQPGRLAASTLTAAGCGDWIARSDDEYVAIASGFADRVASLRSGRFALSSRVRESALCDEHRFVRAFETAVMRVVEEAHRSSTTDGRRAGNFKGD